jgi:hypothetical protein
MGDRRASTASKALVQALETPIEFLPKIFDLVEDKSREPLRVKFTIRRARGRGLPAKIKVS